MVYTVGSKGAFLHPLRVLNSVETKRFVYKCYLLKKLLEMTPFQSQSLENIGETTN